MPFLEVGKRSAEEQSHQDGGAAQRDDGEAQQDADEAHETRGGFDQGL